MKDSRNFKLSGIVTGTSTYTVANSVCNVKFVDISLDVQLAKTDSKIRVVQEFDDNNIIKKNDECDVIFKDCTEVYGDTAFTGISIRVVKKQK